MLVDSSHNAHSGSTSPHRFELDDEDARNGSPTGYVWRAYYGAAGSVGATGARAPLTRVSDSTQRA